MRRILDSLYAVSGWMAALSLLMIAVIVFGQVAFNLIDYLGTLLLGRSFGLLIPSYALFSGYALCFATFLSLGLGFRHAAHIRVTLVEGRLPPALRRWTLTLVAAMGIGMGVLFVWYLGHLAYESWMWGDRATGLVRVPLWIPQSVMWFGSVVFLIAVIDTFVELLLTGKSDAMRDDIPAEETPA